jgi:glycosyltransferase involved in cell wall biosynthesis
VSLKVLLIAEAANPEWPSVPLVGWSLARALRELTGAHVVTQVRNRDAIVRAGWIEGRDFTAIDSERVASPVARVGGFLQQKLHLGHTAVQAASTFSYYYFEHQLWERFKDEIAEGKYDIVHRVTPLSPTSPSLIARRCENAGVPFVWGPINGGVAWPSGFGNVRLKEGELLSFVREAYKALPYYRSTRASASAIIAGSLATREQIAPKWRDKCFYIPENAISKERFPTSDKKRRPGPLRAAFVGRLVPYKGADVLLEAAMPLLRAGRLKLDIIGDGPEMNLLRKMVADEGVEQQVSLPGWIEHVELAKRLREADILAFPSVREFGGGVVLEAMALGLVPVVADYAGPSELVTEQTGFRVPFNSRESLREGFRKTLSELADAPDSLSGYAERARERVERWFTWERKAEQVAEIYAWVLGRGPRPPLSGPFVD